MIDTRLSKVSAAEPSTIDVKGRLFPIGVNPDILTAADAPVPRKNR